MATEKLINERCYSNEIGSRNFRFQPDSGASTVESGPSQFGRNRDAWGHWFGTQNAKPLWNYVIADRYLARNPFVPSASPIQFVLPPNSPPVYPASRAEKRFHSFGESGHFTSACGGMIYGDQRLFGASDELHAFTCLYFMELNLSNSKIAKELELDPNSAHEMTSLLRNGILAKEPKVTLSGEVECDEVSIVVGHKGEFPRQSKKDREGRRRRL